MVLHRLLHLEAQVGDGGMAVGIADLVVSVLLHVSSSFYLVQVCNGLLPGLGRESWDLVAGLGRLGDLVRTCCIVST